MRRAPFLVLAFLATCVILGAAPVAKPGAVVTLRSRPPAPDVKAPAATGEWTEVERLISEQKFEQASTLVAKLLEAARQGGDEDAWTRALIKQVELRTALGGFETAVAELKGQAWPQGALSRVTLDLFYAHALAAYFRAYSWEINQRERVETAKETIDLKLWTREEIHRAAVAAYVDAWEKREALGNFPVGQLAEYLEPNTYPVNVRGTLRDALSYLFTGILADTSLWSSRESNEVYRLDLKSLIAGDRLAADPLLVDSILHPLERLAAVLGDLESWHRGRGEKAAELEARLERSRRLHSAFTRSEDRRLVRRSLEESLPAFRDDSWWAEGMAVLADFVRDEDDPDSLVKAREIAQQGAAAYPTSPGAARCRALVSEIEAPDFQLSVKASDGPGQRSILVTHKNLTRLYFRAYLIDVRRRLETDESATPLPQGWEVRRKLLGQAPLRAWSVELPATPDFRSHRTYAVPPLERPGAYVIAASVRGDFAPAGNRVLSLDLILGDLVLLARPQAGVGLDLQTLSGTTGAPLSGVEIRLYPHSGAVPRAAAMTRLTGAEGTVHLERPAGGEAWGYTALATRGEDQAVLAAWFPEATRREAVTASLLFTDRSIYRPGQKLLWKLLAYGGRQDQGKLKVLPSVPATVKLLDPNNQEAGAATVSTNEFGTAAGEFTIPAGRPLGGWRLQSSLNGTAGVQVEEYKRPTFEVKLEDPRTPLRLNRPATFSGTVRYFFGLPVTEGSVRWQVRRQAIYPWWWGDFRGGGRGTQDEIVAAGQTRLDEDGKFALTFTPRADDSDAADAADAVDAGDAGEGVSYRYRVGAEATDEGGETREVERSFRVGTAAIEASIWAENGFFTAEHPGRLTIRRTDLNEAPRPGAGSWRLFPLRQPETALLPSEETEPESPKKGSFETPGDRQRPRGAAASPLAVLLHGWPDGEARGEGRLRHGADGEAALELPALSAGAYRVRYETTDEFGVRCTAAHEFVVAGERTLLQAPAALLAESSSVRVGETARFFVHSGLGDQPLFLDLYRGGKPVERRRLQSGRGDEILSLAIGEEDRGGVGAVLWLVRDHQMIEASARISVPWDNRELNVEFGSFREEIRPQTRETWRVTVKNADGGGEPAAAEILAYMYDRSLDLFVPHNPPSTIALFPDRGAPLHWTADLGQHSGGWVESEDWPPGRAFAPPEPDRLRFLDSFGIGGLGMRGGMVMKAMMAEAMPAPSAQALGGVAGGVAGGVVGGQPTARDPWSVLKQTGTAVDRVGAGEAAPPAPALRSNFAETAFWQPHLLSGADGSAAIEFTVPDSVTSWNVWVHAVTRDLRSGSLHRETRSVKDLMVRPYLPRFLREGDRADLKVVVNNASKTDLRGTLSLEILDPVDNRSLLPEFGLEAVKAHAEFTVKAGGGTDLTFPITAPRRVGEVAFKVVATAGEFSDGELRTLPVLPSRLHLAQSRFVALRGGPGSRAMTFDDLGRNDDPTRQNEQMVVTLDAQLFYSVLTALPYLVNYPYECTEQTLNRFLSTGIVSSLFAHYPAVGKMAQEMAKRETRYESFDQTDPNRKMALEETPWLEAARGKDPGGESPDLLRVLDPRIARAQRDSALAKLEKAQLQSGAFPWWPGGPPSEYMTLYLMYGFAKAAEFGVDVPRPMVERGWAYLTARFREEFARTLKDPEKAPVEFLTFLNYVASSYPDPKWMGEALSAQERRQTLEISFKHWREHSPQWKAMLALTLKRMGRPQDAQLVFDSVMDSSKTTVEEGTFWQPEDRAWLWYNDSIEGHALALRTLMELAPQDARQEGLVQWLFLNKKLNHWKSTRATAEVLYSLASYLKREAQLGAQERASIAIGGRTTRFVFAPDRYTGKKDQIVLRGEEIDPRRDATITVTKETPGILFASATWHFATDELPKEARGDLFSVTRRYFKRTKSASETSLRPLGEGEALQPGDEIEVQLALQSRAATEYVHLRDPRAAGLEPGVALSGYHWDLGLAIYEETRDSGANFFIEWLPAGEYTLKYRLRANIAGSFRVGPAELQSMYAPEFVAYSAANVVRVGEK